MQGTCLGCGKKAYACICRGFMPAEKTPKVKDADLWTKNISRIY
jgi:hypothetical protein